MYNALLIIAGFVAILVGGGVFFFVGFTADRIVNEASRTAVAIAARDGSISVYQLAGQAGTSIGQARAALGIASRQGRLFKALDGRYYLTPQMPLEKFPEEIGPRRG